LVCMLTLLPRGTGADVEAPLGHECVTLLALVDGPLGPHDVGAAGPGSLRRWERRKPLGHHARLLRVIPKA
jgi:hypothetical protein